jgi:hypothetical protein
MVINEKEFPVVVQAYQPSGTGELFVAEQMVHTQAEADQFTSRYAGYLIKARVVTENEIHRDDRTADTRAYRREPVRSKAGAGWAIVLLLLIALVIVGFTTGWIQRTFDVAMR